MRRFHSPKEQAIMFSRWKMEMEIHRYDWRNPPTDPDACHCAKGIGSMRKRRPFDCGNPQCGVCHGFGKGSKFGPKDRYNELRRAIEFDISVS